MIKTEAHEQDKTVNQLKKDGSEVLRSVTTQNQLKAKEVKTENHLEESEESKNKESEKKKSPSSKRKRDEEVDECKNDDVKKQKKSNEEPGTWIKIYTDAENKEHRGKDAYFIFKAEKVQGKSGKWTKVYVGFDGFEYKGKDGYFKSKADKEDGHVKKTEETIVPENATKGKWYGKKGCKIYVGLDGEQYKGKVGYAKFKEDQNQKE